MSDAKLTKTDQSVKLEIGDLINFDANTVKQVRFGLLSSETIRMQSIGEITQTSSKPDKGTIYDPAMGAVYRWDVCPTCHGDFKTCNGHFAHIHLAKPVMNPKCEIAIKHVLQCVCSYCSHALFRKTHIDMMEIKSSKKLVDRLSQLNSLAKLKKICDNCGKYRVKYIIAEHRVYKVQGDEKIKMPIEDVLRILKNISESDCILLGFDVKMTRPENMIFEELPVIPHCSRPTMRTNGSTNEDSISQVYINIVKCNAEISKASEKDKEHYIDLLNSHISELFFGNENNSNTGQRRVIIKGIANRLGGKQGHFRSNCNGKRSNATGRSVIAVDPSISLDEVGIPRVFAEDLWFPETVYGGKIKINGKIVSHGNKEKLQEMIDKTMRVIDGLSCDEGCAYIRSDVGSLNVETITTDGRVDYVLCENGKGHEPIRCNKLTVEGMPYCNKHKHYAISNGILVHGIIVDGKKRELKYYKTPIKDGDVVLRRIQDGDWVLFNRQPTLHKMSMMAFKVRILRGRSIRVNPAVCVAYNADFDGDEMNLFPAQSYDTRAELAEIANVFSCIISPQNHRNIITVIQDTILGAGKMTVMREFWEHDADGKDIKTKHCVYLPKHIFHDLVLQAYPEGYEYTLKDIVVGIIHHEWEKITIIVKSVDFYRADISPIDATNILVEYYKSATKIDKSYKMEKDGKKIVNIKNIQDVYHNSQDVLVRYEVADNDHGVLDLYLSSLQTRAMKVYGKDWMNTRVAISALFPSNYCYEFHNETDKDEPTLRIRNGIIISGCLCKKVLGPVHNSIIQDLWHRYSPEIAGMFITKLQQIVARYMPQEGFSVGISDCIIKNYDEVKQIVYDVKSEVEACSKTRYFGSSEMQNEYVEAKIAGILNGATGKGNKLVSENLPSQCRLRDMVTFGSKGNTVNIMQITNCVGQQNIQGSRPKLCINNNTRVLPHFPTKSTDPESQGFVKSSFRDGLSATEFFFHMMGGRDGISDMATKTSDTGYIQRRMTKATEDLITRYDGSVRNSVGSVYTLLYGDIGVDPTRLVKCRDGKPFFCDIHRIVNSLNNEYEQSVEIS